MTEITVILWISAVVIASIWTIVALYRGLKQKYPSSKKIIDGDLIIDTKDPHKDVFRFELYYSPEKLMEDKTKEYVTFKIVRND